MIGELSSVAAHYLNLPLGATLSTTEAPVDIEAFVVSTIEEMIRRRGTSAPAVRMESTFLEDLSVESLELAELSAALEDKLGRDPFSEGILPDTVGDLVAYYRPEAHP